MVAAAVALNLLSIVARSFAWQIVINQAMPPPRPRFPLVFSAFCVACSRTRCCRDGSAVRAGRGAHAQVASAEREVGDLVGTVFAHRVFDIVPALLLIGYVLATADIPGWALTSLIAVVSVGSILFLLAFVSAWRHHRSVRRKGGNAQADRDDGAVRPRRDARAAAAIGAIFFQCLGWLCQFFAVYTAMLGFDIHVPLPAAGLVLVLMNLATIFPLWPGNVGLTQAAIALPLVQYRSPVREGVRVRHRAAADRGLGPGRRRPLLPRARGALVRDAAPDAGDDRGRVPGTGDRSPERTRA